MEEENMKNQKFIYQTKKIQVLLHQAIQELHHYPMNHTITYAGFFGVKNWGDAINSILLQQLSGKTPIISPLGKQSNRCLLKTSEIIYSFIGSTLELASKKKNLIVYGTGFMNSNDRIIQKPKKICAVRGPLTAERIIESIEDCPKIYGDPAVLFKRYYQPKADKKYNLGIVPHWSDYQKISHCYANIPGVHVINAESGSTQFIDEICSCRCIASSSLHGLIMADTYDIPTVWIKMISGLHPDDFKFYDYYGSIRCEREPINLFSWNIDDICSGTDLISHPINSEKLLMACPFLQPHTEQSR
ncbi:MAG TPA: polysaccharide pyruvyl transferase family protein [Methanocorpusculum sp.]|nr:polysaccharide pyruvyl transferase family protein [Methanocorpusculum sp.]HJK52768.1 polysaccharide pyruvyl transferase family protein [Methanocorpusculum sp.]HJK69374.1 polysaccharide pyruvyl transferase family protein [Methanocorpusculum sp.]